MRIFSDWRRVGRVSRACKISTELLSQDEKAISEFLAGLGGIFFSLNEGEIVADLYKSDKHHCLTISYIRNCRNDREGNVVADPQDIIVIFRGPPDIGRTGATLTKYCDYVTQKIRDHRQGRVVKIRALRAEFKKLDKTHPQWESKKESLRRLLAAHEEEEMILLPALLAIQKEIASS